MQAIQEQRFLWRTTATVTYLEPTPHSGTQKLRCAFTTRQAGWSGRALNLSFDKGRRDEVLANRQEVLRVLGLGHTALFTVRQVHGNRVCIVDEQGVRGGLEGVTADALVTALPEVPLGVLVADCLPVVLYSHRPSVVAVVHAGRMGTYHRIVLHVLEVMQSRFGVQPEQVQAILGPAIEACCYLLDERAVRPFQERFPDWERYFTPHRAGRWTMSLTVANTAQLRAAGVLAAHMQAAQICTACHWAHLYSHRAEGEEAGRGLGIAAMLAE